MKRKRTPARVWVLLSDSRYGTDLSIHASKKSALLAGADIATDTDPLDDAEQQREVRLAIRRGDFSRAIELWSEAMAESDRPSTIVIEHRRVNRLTRNNNQRRHP